MSEVATPGPVAPVKLSPEELKQEAMGIGTSYLDSGSIQSSLDYYKNHPTLKDNLTQEHFDAIATNAQPKNATPEATATNAVMKGMWLADKCGTAAQNASLASGAGAAVGAPSSADIMRKGLQDALAQLKDPPGSPGAIANQAYFGALTRGAGVMGAADVYAKTYMRQVEQQNAVALEATKKQLDFQIKNQDRIALTKSVTDNIAKTLAGTGSNIPSAGIAQISEQASQILASAHTNPEAAGGAARALLQQLSDSGVSERQLTTIAKNFSNLVKMDPTKQKTYDQLSNVEGLSGSGALTRWQFDIPTEADSKKIADAIDALKKKEAKQEADAAGQKKAAEITSAAGAEITPVPVPGKPGVFMTPQAIASQGAGMKAGAEAGAKLPFEKSLASFKDSLELASAEEKKYKQTIGEKRGETMAALPGQVSSAKQAISTIADLKDSMNSQMIQTNVGIKAPIGSLLSKLPATQSRDFNNILDTLKSEQFLSTVKGMKGLGALSDAEGRKIESAIAKLDKNSSVEQFNKNLETIQTSLTRMVEENRKFAETGKVGDVRNPKAVGGAVESAPAAPKVRKYNPATGALE